MAAARERRISLYAYDTRADAEANTNGTEYTSGIVDDTPRYEHVFFTEFPGWGEANAAMFSCDISGTADLSDKWVRVKYSYYATDAAATMTDKWLFLGRVDSCKYDTLKTVRTLVAYDLLYWLRSVDISEYWANYWSNEDRNRSIAAFLSNMSADFGVTLGNIGATMLPTSTITAAGAKATTLSGCSFVDMLAFIGQLCRVYFFIGGDGKLNCARTSNAETPVPVDALIDTQNTEIGDGALPAYTAMMAYSGADVIYSTGSGEPLYTIRDNPLLNGKTTAEITTQLNALFSELDNVTGFWPGEFEYIVSSPEEFGNVATGAVTYTPNLSTQDGNETRLHAAAAVECWGVQLINQRVTCPTAMTTGGAVSASMSAALNAIQQMGVEMTYKVNADNVIEAVNLEAQGGVTINAQAININGVVSANENFKVDEQGNMEAANGKFTGQITATSGTIGNVEIDGAKLVAQQSGSSYGDALFIAETDTDKAYFGASVVRIEAPPDFAGVGTVSILTKESLTSENRISGNGYTSSFDLRRMDNRGGASLNLSETNKTSAGTERSSVDVKTQGLAPSITMRHIPAGQTLADKQVTISPSGFEAVDSGTPTKITKTELIAGGKDILRTHQSLVGGYGTGIEQNSDLNTTEFLSVRRFFCQYDTYAGTLINCPTRYAFMMDVFAPISATINDESSPSGSKYRVRRILTRYGAVYYQQASASGATWSFGKWWQALDNNPATALFKEQLASKNIINNASIRNGSLDGSGGETTSYNRVRTGFMGVAPNTNYSINTHSSLQIYEIHEYSTNSASGFIKYTTVNQTTKAFKTSGTTTYIRILMRYSDDHQFGPDEAAMLNMQLGEVVPTTYTPYQVPQESIVLPLYTISDLGTTTTDSAYFQAWLKRVGASYSALAEKIIQAQVLPNARGVVFGHMYGGRNANGMPNYSGFTYISVGVLKYFGTNGGTFYLRSVNYTSEV